MKTTFELYQADGAGSEFYGTRSGDWYPIPDSTFTSEADAVAAARELVTAWGTPVAVFAAGDRYPQAIVAPDVAA